MDNYARKRLTYILATLTSLSIVAFSHGRPISQVGETRGLHPPGDTQGTDSGEDCLHNQYYSDELQMCQNCTYCYPGTQHSPTVEKCGFSSGHETTCSPCETGYYQPGEGYSDLKCYRCVTCYNAEVLKQCTPTQNAECGDCFPGMYKMAENTCIECIYEPSHRDCIKSIPVLVNDPASGTQPSPNQTSPTHLAPTPHEPTISRDLTLENATGVPPNVTEVNDDKGTSTTKFSWREGVFVTVGVVVICIIFLLGLRYKKCCSGDRASEPSKTSTCTSSNRKVAFRAVPNGAPDSGGESEQQRIPSPYGTQI
ncbi:uncharacterized protein LOC121414170 isoform X2 [Lytechinus variegatus]|uniref:uncharacterized protein LOC121414170 isoform X2 n=1 Tax=Lytechinus variegatus TaxID=7654 RepID=UPI001BB26B5B|nr:uncharacterized protein LOC121414170 isoform X2 [Lytechinus variegatus]